MLCNNQSVSIEYDGITRCYDGGDCNQGMFVICWLLDCSAGWTVTDRLEVLPLNMTSRKTTYQSFI